MLEDFISHIRSKYLLDTHKRYLLAISGGIDSVALGHLLHQSGFNFDLATVNFNLRGEASSGDYEFVSQLSVQWGCKFFGHIVDVRQWEEKGTESIQMKARSIRYEWLESIRQAHGYAAILVAHHREDQLETIFLNLLRSTGVEGVFGMADVRDTIIRPLLPFRKKSLVQYMKAHHFTWREDGSNQQNKYKRNYIRNQLLHTLEEDYPEALELLHESFARIKDTGKAFFYLYESWKKTHIEHSGMYQYVSIQTLEKTPGKQSMLYYWLRDYGFSSVVVGQIGRALEEKTPGKLFHSPTHTVNIDRTNVILGKRMEVFQPIELTTHEVSIQLPHISYEILKIEKDDFLDTSSLNAMMDVSKLIFPLTIRRWEVGDKFIPLGMQKEKKVSDLLIDLKVPLIDKANVCVMLSADKVVWVVGYRISELVKCDKGTQQVVYFKRRQS